MIAKILDNVIMSEFFKIYKSIINVYLICRLKTTTELSAELKYLNYVA